MQYNVVVVVVVGTLMFLCHLGTALDERQLHQASFFVRQPQQNWNGNAALSGVFPDLSKFCSHHVLLFVRASLPDFLKNVSTEGMKAFCAIVTNATLTKGEIKQELEQWAKDQGGDVYDKFEKFLKSKQEQYEKVEQEMQELLLNTSKYVSDLFMILSNPNITFKEEMKEIYNITEESGPLVVMLALVARVEVGYLSKSKQPNGVPIGDLLVRNRNLFDTIVPHIRQNSRTSLNVESIGPQFWTDEVMGSQ